MSSFGNLIYGDYGDEKKNHTTQYLPLGAEMALPDGRTFAYAQVGGTALVAGKLYQQEAVASGTGNVKSLAVVGAAAGASTMRITMSGTGALTKDQYKDGYVFTASSVGTGIGYTYKIASNNSAAAGSTGTLTLYKNDTIKVALEADTTTVGLRVNPYKHVLLTTSDTVGVGTLAGVSCATAAASTWVWLQKTGEASVFTDNTTLIVGMPVIASTTVAGAVGLYVRAAGTTTQAGKGVSPIGICISVAASAEFSLIDLAIK